MIVIVTAFWDVLFKCPEDGGCRLHRNFGNLIHTALNVPEDRIMQSESRLYMLV